MDRSKVLILIVLTLPVTGYASQNVVTAYNRIVVGELDTIGRWLASTDDNDIDILAAKYQYPTTGVFYWNKKKIEGGNHIWVLSRKEDGLEIRVVAVKPIGDDGRYVLWTAYATNRQNVFIMQSSNPQRIWRGRNLSDSEIKILVQPGANIAAQGNMTLYKKDRSYSAEGEMLWWPGALTRADDDYDVAPFVVAFILSIAGVIAVIAVVVWRVSRSPGD